MTSIHVHRSMTKADDLGAWAGDCETLDIWGLSKRELVEIALRLGARAGGQADSPERGAHEVRSELESLRRAGII